MFEVRHEDTRISFVVADDGLLINIGYRHEGYAITLSADETAQLIAALTPMIPELKANAVKAEEDAIEKAAAKIRQTLRDEEAEARRVEEEAAKREAFKAELRAEILAEMESKPEEGGGV